MRLIVLILLLFALPAWAVDTDGLLNLHQTETDIIGVSSKNRDTLIAYLEGQRSVAAYPLDYVLVIELNFAGVERRIAYKTFEDIPYQSVSVECPTADSHNKRTCWFIKYSDAPTQNQRE